MTPQTSRSETVLLRHKKKVNISSGKPECRMDLPILDLEARVVENLLFTIGLLVIVYSIHAAQGQIILSEIATNAHI